MNETLRSEKRKQLLLKTLSNDFMPSDRTKLGSILQADRSQILVLSYAQRRLWFLDQYNPSDSSYNIPLALRVQGAGFSPDILQRVLDDLLARHESLRTVFTLHCDEPQQLIHPTLTLPIPKIDLSGLENAEREQALIEHVQRESNTVFELDKGPLIRAQLIQLAVDEHVVQLTMHHSVSDSWSMGVLVQELALYYAARFEQREPTLPPLPIQYADYAVWQHDRLQGGFFEKQLKYWRVKLSGAPALLELPTDRARPKLQTAVGAEHRFMIEPELGKCLSALSQQHGATMFMLLEAAFKVLLNRYSGQEDISIGTPIAGRNRAELEGLIGFFVNTLVLRDRIDGQSSFVQLLEQCKQTALEAYAHQEVPFERLVEELSPERSLSYSPLFQVMFVLQNAPMETLEVVSGLSFEVIRSSAGVTKFDLTCSFTEEKGGRLWGELEYNTDLFDEETIQQLARHYEVLLQGICTNPSTKVEELPLLSAEEEHQILVEWNDTRLSNPKDKTIQALFEEQVSKTPNGAAVVYEDQQYTYSELNAKANQLAHYLRGLGIGPEMLVGICVERSLEMVVGLLGVVKAGGGYVPLDPSYPKQRLAFMLQDAKPKVLLTQKRLLAELPAYEGSVLCLDQDWPEIEQSAQANPDNLSQPGDLAYVIYTSGSTGQPKGAMNEHKGLCNLTYALCKSLDVGPGSRVLQFASLSFDACVFEVFISLCAGGQLHLAARADLMPGESLAKTIHQQQISHVLLPPSALGAMRENEATLFDSLKTLVVGGEACSTELAEYWGHGDRRLINAYGPSEATIIASMGEFVEGETLSIGRPLRNMQLYVLDENQTLLPIGVIGELYISGVGLGRGYLNRAELTAQHFVPNPFDQEGSERLYRTGDLVRYRADGSLEYLGRTDDQVKLRGFRIELGEIEAVLEQSELVTQAVVQLREDIQGDKRLVAYVVVKEQYQLVPEVLRAHLKTMLPEHMVPGAFEQLEQLPKTPNGKVDRNALPAPRGERQVSKKYVAPRTQTEKALADIWITVLKVEKVGVEDDFFALGGHSLLATQVLSKMKAHFDVEIALRALFEATTVASLAERISQAQLTQGVERQLPIEAVAREPGQKLALSFAQQRLWFFDQFSPNTAVYNIPVALKLRGALQVDQLERVFNELLCRHETLRTVFRIIENEVQQIILAELKLELNKQDLRSEGEQASHVVGQISDRLQALIEDEATHPFDLSEGPLLRVSLIQLDAEEHVLLLSMHHIITDGWSMGVLVKEVTELYRAFVSGQASMLPDLMIQYADYALWQRERLHGDYLQEQLKYWKKQLNGAAALLELPTDRVRPAVQRHRGATYNFEINEALVAQLKGLAHAQGATLFMVVQAVFKVLLSRYSGQDDISVGTSIAGRNRVELEGLIGFFVNTLVLRDSIDRQISFEQLLKQVKETALEAYANQEVPFELLVEELSPERSLSYSPLFQVMFELQNASMETLEVSGLGFEPLDSKPGVAKFDMSCSLTEDQDGGLLGGLEYSTDLFDEETIKRFVRHYKALLQGVCDSPQSKLGELTLLSAEEEHQILVEWNNTTVPYQEDKTIQQWFEAQVYQTPEATAVVFENQQFSYSELNTRANQLAHYLRGLGVGPETLVGICVERGLDMIAGLLGILKSGGCFLPLDPSYPNNRLAFMLQDAKPKVLLTQEALLTLLPHCDGRVLCLDRDWHEVGQSAKENPCNLNQPPDLAYVIYTSGSTGKPKGVMISHSALGGLLEDMASTLSLNTHDRWLSVTSLSFDIAMLELLLPLRQGACSLIATRAQATDARLLSSMLKQHQITVLQATPSTWRLLSNNNNDHQQWLLRVALCGGESWDRKTGRFIDSVSERVWNVYGPTETTIWSTRCEVLDGVEPSLGRPIANTQMYVLDESLGVLPIGVIGELYIGGAGLARGYLNRHELTEQRFVPNPFDSKRSERLYRTGDLVRYRSDGNIEYVGRSDSQVKLRGFRIELGEVEALLEQSAQVIQAVVQLHEYADKDKCLVAYLVPQLNDLVVEELRNDLRTKLPEYMVPSAVVTLESLPLTPNGKLNRSALPSPGEGALERGEYVAPRTEIEKELAEIWTEVLKVERVGVEDDFFALGGHSLLAMQLLSQVRAHFEVELALRELFEATTVASLAVRVTRAQEQRGVERQLPIEPVAREPGQKLALSFAQQRLWFLDQYSPNTAVYNIPVALKLLGPVQVNVLERVFNDLVGRHETLRTVFQVEKDEAQQIILSELKLTLTQKDLRDRGEQPDQVTESVSDRIQAIVKEEAATPFDLSAGPLMRVSLIRLGTEEHVLLVTMHHIISDGWSMGVLVKEVVALYEAFVRGHASMLAELPIQYADFALWQRERLHGEILQEQLGYWEEQLSGAAAWLDLPTDRARPAVLTHRGAIYHFELSEVLTDQLRDLAQAQGATLFMVLLAGFKLLLNRYSGQEDISVGTPIAGRNRAELEGLVGLFVNTLVLRDRTDRQSSFEQFLAQVKETALEAYAHQEVPFERLVEELSPERSLTYSPLFQVMFVLQNAPMEALEVVSGLSFEAIRSNAGVTKFDLTCSFTEEKGGRLWGGLEYNTDLFDEETMRRLARHYEVLLQGICTNPSTKVGELPLLSEEEEHQLLVEWNDTRLPNPKDKTIHELFEEQVSKTPDGTALVYEDQQCTYSELNAKANQLAYHLRGLGIGPEVLVGICVERSVEMVVGLLGILKAGGGYLPLDPSYPKQRLWFMLQDAKPKVLLTQKKLLAELPRYEGSVVCLDRDWAEIEQSAQVNPDNLSQPGDLAYVIYTSGSTGQPKGAMNEHKGLCNLTYALRNSFDVTPSSRVLQFSSLCFDASVFEVFTGLCAGGQLHLAAQADLMPGESLANTIHRQQISHVLLPPSALGAMHENEATLFDSLKTLVVGGEACSTELAEYWSHSNRRFINSYGPSEATVTTSLVEFVEGEPLSIGRPLRNVQLYVLDDSQTILPIGVIGELYIGGVGLGRGYLNRPELTAERFVPNPFDPEGLERLYRTGDLVRYRADGNLEYLGRTDHQVKLRGFRIELGEIEAVLKQSELVKQAVVLLREDVPGDERLVAYVEPELDESAVEQLRVKLRLNLPDFMVPAALVTLQALPLTLNGKLNRAALTSPDDGALTRGKYLAPRTKTEAQLARIWAEILGVKRVSVYDNFFELGGHSLLATRLITLLSRELGVEVPLRALFEQPELGQLANWLEHAEQGATIEPIRKADRSQTLMLSYAQRRLWFLDQYNPLDTSYNVPVALRVHGASFCLDILQQVLDDLIARHESLRTVFTLHGDEPQQLIHPTLTLSVPKVDLSGLENAEREQALIEHVQRESNTVFELDKGPLIRAQLIQLAVDEHVVQLTMHHSVSDGWSMGILAQELAHFYEARSERREPSLRALPIQYADYAVWQRERLQGVYLEEQLGYWREQLDGAPALLELPTDRTRPKVQTYVGAQHRFVIEPALGQRLSALAQQHGATMFMVLEAAFKVLLYRYSGQRDICVGTPIAGRNRVELEGLIGFFVNTLVLRTKIDPQVSFEHLLEQCMQTALEAYAYQEVSFEQLVEELSPERSLSFSPLFQVMFVLQNAPMQTLAVSGLSFEGLDVSASVSKFDLTCNLTEVQGGQILGEFEYNTDLFDEETIQRMAKHFDRLLHGICANPKAKLHNLQLLSAKEEHQILVEWNNTSEFVATGLVHERITDQAREHAEDVAILWHGQSYTYGWLETKANKLAHWLIQRGVGPETRVAICLQRTPELIVALLGVLKAGGAYVPLDPLYPVDRLSFILDDSEASLLLTQQNVIENVPWMSGVPRIDLDAEQQPWSQCPVDAPPFSGSLDCHLAYVIYTSGSTGQPKGVAVTHQGIMNLVGAQQRAFSIRRGTRVLQFASISFDASVSEVFTALTVGATLILPNSAIEDFLGELGDCEPEVATLPPALLSQIRPTELPSLKTVVSAGEVLSLEVARVWCQSHRLINAYGPTEATVCAAMSASIEPATCEPPLVIGRPIENMRLYILDNWLLPVPVGVAGELYIGGLGVARGYLNRAALTAEMFVPDPFSDDAGGRLYRTGDSAKYRHDGQVEFLGRLDQQVKVRGYRIEPGEIESQLLQHELIKEAIVVVHSGDAASGHSSVEIQLVAYVTPTQVLEAGEEVELAELVRSALATSLPDYMVPSLVIVLEQFQLTANGKVDRKALPSPDSSDLSRKDYVAPVSAVEMAVAEIWQELLSVKRVGRHDNFFELGGHSLLAVTLLERLRRKGYRTDVKTLFTTQTLGGLSLAIEQQDDQEQWSVPPNLIELGTNKIEPSMLPLISLSEREIAAVIECVPGGAANIQDIYPLAPLQEGILFHHLMSTETDAYVLSTLLSFDTRERLDSVLVALQQVIDRHDILRTAVLWEELEQPLQVVLREAALRIEEVELDSVEGMSAAENLMSQYGPQEQRIEVRQAPMIRVVVSVDQESGQWLLLLLSHHMISDHATLEVVIKESQTHIMGQQEQLPAPQPFRDYIAQTQRGHSVEEHEAFFTAMLGDVDTPTVPYGLFDVQSDGRNAREHTLVLDNDLAIRVRECARQMHVSAASVWHLAWARVLSQIAGTDQVVFGTVLFGRMHGELSIERALGLFINTLPIRIEAAEGSIEAGLLTTHSLLAELLRHEHASLALAQRCSAVGSKTPLFSSLLNYRHTHIPDHGDLTTKDDGVSWLSGKERTNYPVNLSVDDTGKDFLLSAQVDSSVDPEQVCRLTLTALEGLVEGLEQNPKSALSDIAVLDELERRKQLVDWNETSVQYAESGQQIHSLFEQQVKKNPDAIALVFAEQTLSYYKLNERANRLAHALRKRSVGPEVLVSLCLERSLEMVVGLLGVLKAGGAYVPIDPSYPAERLEYMLEDAAPALLLTQEALLGRLPTCQCDVLCLDRDWENYIEPCSADNPELLNTEHDLSYVIYTSGSTGQPKGVGNIHSGLLNRLLWMQQRYALTVEDCVVQKTPMSFDVSVWEFFWPLISGARLHLARPEGHKDADYLIDLFELGSVSTAHFVPSMLEEFVAALEQSGRVLPKLRRVICSGEALSVGLQNRFFDVTHGRHELHNLYGPTEASIDVSEWACIAKEHKRVPIGRPIANTQLYVLDKSMEILPIGVVGELYIGGAGLARGYLNRPELTAERFVDNLIDPDRSKRLYRTGDLVRYRADGNLEYVGRTDHQVKLRGFRVELGEIEFVLEQSELVSQAVVQLREDVEGDQRLVAYLVPQLEESALDHLRTTLHTGLPAYMVPSALITLESLPLTPNGKLDRGALPAPEGTGLLRSEYVAPEGSLEESLADIWQELLGVERVGRYDNFFDLGGHSLLVMRLIVRIKDSFDVNVPMADIFEDAVLLNLKNKIIDLKLSMHDQSEVLLDQAELEKLSDEELEELL